MTLQNRVLPTGEIVAEPWRGSLMGNRGCLHGPDGSLGRSRWRHANWVTCLLAFRGRHRLPMPPPGSRTVYTALFFWDEASAFAAGHRPCGECRNADWRRFKAHWQAAGLPGTYAGEIDRHLHTERTAIFTGTTSHAADAALELPDGTVIRAGNGCLGIIADRAFHPWQRGGGYGAPTPLPDGRVAVLTPPAIIAVFEAGYRPGMRLGADGCHPASSGVGGRARRRGVAP